MANTISMYGPAFGENGRSGALVNREVPICDVPAYQAAGYVEGVLDTVADVNEIETHPVTIHNIIDPKAKRSKAK